MVGLWSVPPALLERQARLREASQRSSSEGDWFSRRGCGSDRRLSWSSGARLTRWGSYGGRLKGLMPSMPAADSSFRAVALEQRQQAE